MSKRSRSCSDIRGASIIKSTRYTPWKRDSSTRLSLLEPKCTYVQGSPYERLSTLDDFDLDDIERQIKKNETLSKLIHSLIVEKQKRQSISVKSEQSSLKFSSDTGASAKKPSTDQLSVSTSKFKEKPTPSNVTDNDIEYMREIIRIDKGLPSIQEKKKKSIDVRKMPKVLPRPTKLSESRYQRTRASYPRLRSVSCRDDSSCHNKSIDNYDRSPEDIRGDEDLRRLKYLAESHKSSNPSYRFNRVFTLRYQYNKGTPEMPDSFRRSYERYNKPLFRMVKGLELPKKYLMPKFSENEISLFGLANEVPFQTHSRKTAEENCLKQRERIARRGRVLRMSNVKPPGRKIPWNYGRVRSCSPVSRY